MKKIILIICIFFIGAISAQTPVLKNLENFSILKVYNGITVELIRSIDQKIEITGEKSTQVLISNTNGTLKLSLPFSINPKDNSAEGKVTVKLFYNKNIDEIAANNSATITAKDFKQLNLALFVRERGFIALNCDLDYLKVMASSGGIIKLSGTTKTQEIDVDLYGVYHGFNMISVVNSIVKSGNGAKAEINSIKTLHAKVSFGGSIFYKGSPVVIKDKKVIGGIIQQRN